MFRNLIKSKIFIFLVFFIVGFLIYANTFNNQFFWDDDDSIVNNVYIKNWQYLPNYFTENLIAGSGQATNYWRPLLLISFSLDYHLWGLKPPGFHLTNIILHIANAFLVFLFLSKIIILTTEKSNGNYFLSAYLPFLVSLIFLIHPLQTEAVTYTAGRADPLSAFFSLGAILFYIYHRRKREIKIWQWRKGGWAYAASLIFFIAGLFIKEQVILLPVLLILVEVCIFFKKPDKKNFLEAIKSLFPYFFISIIYFILRLTLLNFNDILSGFSYSEEYDANIWSRLFTFTYVIIEYFKLLFFPFGLHMAREVPIFFSFFSWPIIFFILLLALIIFVSVKTWRINKLITFGFLWFFIILLPRANIFQINRPMYEHWLYLPMIGFWLSIFLLAAIFISKTTFLTVKNILFKRIGLGILIIYLIFFAVLTIRRNNDWQNPIIFYEKNLRFTPNSFIQHNNLGMAYADAGRHEEAVKEYKITLSIADKYPQVHSNLGNSLRASGQIEEAIEEYKKAISMSPEFIIPYNNLLAIYMGREEKDKINELLKENVLDYKREGKNKIFFIKKL